MSKIKAIIFDMDGVLIDAKEWHYESLNRALRHFGFEITRYDHLTAYDGLPTKKKLEMLSREKNFPIELHNFVNELKQIYTMQLVYSECRPRFGTEYALSRLSREGFSLGVASNSIRRTVEAMMENAALTQYLDVILSNQDVKMPKPAPDIYLKAVCELNVAPEEVLVIEDNDNGIMAAKSSGCWVLEVSDVSEVRYSRIREKINQIEEEVVV